MTFSQSNEEAVLLRALPGAPGRFLDIGAYDGHTFSNTRALALRGWGGVCVEASRLAFEKLAELYRERPDVSCVHAALTLADDGWIELWETPDALSTTEESNRTLWSKYTKFERTLVPALSIASLLPKLGGPVQVLTVDTEGTSGELALALVPELDRAHPGALRFVCVEHDGKLVDIAAALERLGFSVLASNGENLILQRG